MIKRGMLAVTAVAVVLAFCAFTGCGGKKDDNGGLPLPHDSSENAKSFNPKAAGTGAKGVEPPSSTPPGPPLK
jgi:ABC-type oligopeptide transport system substrate-binding subunit